MNEILIDLIKIKNNLKTINKKIIAVVKSDAYSLGCGRIASFIEPFIERFAVTSIKDATNIRKYGAIKPIMLFGCDYDINKCLLYSFEISLNTLKDIEKYKDKPLKVHLKINTGMNRYGIDASMIDIALDLIKKSKLKLISIYTHIYDGKNKDSFNKQQKIINEIQDIHFANSDTLLNNETNNTVRIGNAMYGLDYNECAFSLQSEIVQINKVKKGENVGYGINILKEDSYIAVIPIGYSHGFLKSNEKGFVFINNKRYQIIGSICMECLMVKVSKEEKVLDKVELIGDNITIKEVANRCNTISYEIVCNLKNIKRSYKK